MSLRYLLDTNVVSEPLRPAPEPAPPAPARGASGRAGHRRDRLARIRALGPKAATLPEAGRDRAVPERRGGGHAARVTLRCPGRRLARCRTRSAGRGRQHLLLRRRPDRGHRGRPQPDCRHPKHGRLHRFWPRCEGLGQARACPTAATTASSSSSIVTASSNAVSRLRSAARPKRSVKVRSSTSNQAS